MAVAHIVTAPTSAPSQSCLTQCISRYPWDNIFVLAGDTGF